MAIYMKNGFKILLCITALFLMTTTVFASQVELYALDGRTLMVEEDQVAVYTAEGMGWFKDKPVTMHSADGRTIVVPLDRVEAQKKVGWFVSETNDENKAQTPEDVVNNQQPDVQTPVTPPTTEGKTAYVKYTDGTIVKVPYEHVDMYKTLGWVQVESDQKDSTITIYDNAGNSKTVNVADVAKYILEGWSTVKKEENSGGDSGEDITVYSYDGQQKTVPLSQLDTYKAQGWYPAYDEAVYAYAAFGNGADVLGATKLLENKSYELAFNLVQDALDKLEGTNSEYVSLLYYLRSSITDTWRTAANSPLGFINYWFSDKDGKGLVVFEYRNVSNSRIQSFKINFDICDEKGTVIETNAGSYYVDKLEMIPCDKKRVAWVIKTGDSAKSIKNLKVKEVVFSDGTKWTSSN